MFKIATWNVNSIRVRWPQISNWLKIHQPDILALQETKVTNAQFPSKIIQAAGYHVLFSGQKTYNGVALLSRQPGHHVVTDLPDFTDPQRRVLGATYDHLSVLNLYVPLGAVIGSEKYQYKLNWLKQLHDYVHDTLSHSSRLIVLGDFNIAFEDRDISDPGAWEGDILVSLQERSALQQLLNLGLQDTFRLFEQPPSSFSWWDYRGGAFRRNHGARIDLILASTALVSQCTYCFIDIEPRRLKQPSDHAPVIATFQF